MVTLIKFEGHAHCSTFPETNNKTGVQWEMALIFQMKPRSDWGPCPIIVADVSERTFIFRISCVPMTTKEIASAATHAAKQRSLITI